MRTLVYIDGPAVPDHLHEWAQKQEGAVSWRNGQRFRHTDRRADRVVTDLPDVREAYEAEGVEVAEMPTPEDSSKASPRYVPEEASAGWVKIKDRQTGEYVDGESKRSMDAAQRRADQLNNE